MPNPARYLPQTAISRRARAAYFPASIACIGSQYILLQPPWSMDWASAGWPARSKTSFVCFPLGVSLVRTKDEDRLDEVFHALANRTRRSLLKTLAGGPARVTALAEPHGMSVAGISKHLFVLERAGLIRRTRKDHVQSLMLDAGPMANAEEWISAYRRFWTEKIDRLAVFVEGTED